MLLSSVKSPDKKCYQKLKPASTALSLSPCFVTSLQDILNLQENAERGVQKKSGAESQLTATCICSVLIAMRWELLSDRAPFAGLRGAAVWR